MHPPIPADALTALRAYAADHGRTWKSKLRDEWYRASAIGPLHALRNTHGPTWLTNFTFPPEDPLPLALISDGDHHYGLPALPVADNGAPGFVHVRTDADLKSLGLRWSGKTATPPAVGDRIEVTMNGIGYGRVLGYFIEHRFLGLHVLPENPPKWFVNQNKDVKNYKGQALVFGAEVSY